MRKTIQHRALGWWEDISLDAKITLCNKYEYSIELLSPVNIEKIFMQETFEHEVDDMFKKYLPVKEDSKDHQVSNMLMELNGNLMEQALKPKQLTRQGTYFNGDGDNATGFTDEEVKAAKATRDQIIRDDVQTLKAIYMAGEICMWDELRWNKPTQNESAYLANPHTEELSTPPVREVKGAEEVVIDLRNESALYAKRQGSHDNPNTTAHDFFEGAQFGVQYASRFTKEGYSVEGWVRVEDVEKLCRDAFVDADTLYKGININDWLLAFKLHHNL